MGIFNKLFGFRWSLYIVRNENELYYAMDEHSVKRIIGHVMRYFADGGKPVDPWSLYLNFNKKHQTIKLDPEHFTPAGDMTYTLIREIEGIDPGYEVPGGEPVFMDMRTKKELKIRHKVDFRNLQKEIDDAVTSKEPTFFSIMDEVFGKNV